MEAKRSASLTHTVLQQTLIWSLLKAELGHRSGDGEHVSHSLRHRGGGRKHGCHPSELRSKCFFEALKPQSVCEDCDRSLSVCGSDHHSLFQIEFHKKH